jgi:hypothetical protein
MFVNHCTVLYGTVLYCTQLCRTVLYCTVLYCIVLYCVSLRYLWEKSFLYELGHVLVWNPWFCTVLYCTVLYCIVLYCTVQYCIVLFPWFCKLGVIQGKILNLCSLFVLNSLRFTQQSIWLKLYQFSSKII